MENQKSIKFTPTSHRQYFEITLNGFRVGAIFTNGRVINNHSMLIGSDPVTGLSKLLGLSITEATDIFVRESWSATSGEEGDNE